MAKTTHTSTTPPEAVISIVGVGMTLIGDSETDGSLRVEGTVRGNIRAGKSVVIGKEAFVDGNIYTQDAVIAGRVSGGIHAESRLELQATSEVSGEIEAPRMQVEEGAKVQGQVAVGGSSLKSVKPASHTTPPQSIGGGATAGSNIEPRSDDGGSRSEPGPESHQSREERQTGLQR